MLASPQIFEKAETIKQALDACTSNFTQILANEFLVQNKLEPYLNFLRTEYAERKELMNQALKKYMSKEITWVVPKGGFYIWLRLPKYIESTKVFKESIKDGVVFVTGRTFDPSSKKDDRLRLSFSNVPKKDIEKGIQILARSIEKVISS
jgi:DNA-binding transcriptional MocR family regulator